MSVNAGELNVKIDVDMSSFDKSIDAISEKITNIKSSIASVSIDVSKANTAFDLIKSTANTLNKVNQIDNKVNNTEESPLTILNNVSSNILPDSNALSNDISLAQLGEKETSMQEIAEEEAKKILNKEAALLLL